VGAFSEMFFAK